MSVSQTAFCVQETLVLRSRIVDPATGKLWFCIVDYTGATRLFDEWDRPPGPLPEAPGGPRTAALEGQVVFAESGALIVGVEQLADPRVFRLSPFREMGRAPGVIWRFGGAERLQEVLDEVQRRLYAA